MQKVLYFSRLSGVVVVVIDPSLTVQYAVSPRQPVRSLPLKML